MGRKVVVGEDASRSWLNEGSSRWLLSWERRFWRWERLGESGVDVEGEEDEGFDE